MSMPGCDIGRSTFLTSGPVLLEHGAGLVSMGRCRTTLMLSLLATEYEQSSMRGSVPNLILYGDREKFSEEMSLRSSLGGRLRSSRCIIRRYLHGDSSAICAIEVKLCNPPMEVRDSEKRPSRRYLSMTGASTMTTPTKNYTVVQLVLSHGPRHCESKKCIHLE